jgi:hypothetical protein
MISLERLSHLMDMLLCLLLLSGMQRNDPYLLLIAQELLCLDILHRKGPLNDNNTHKHTHEYVCHVQIAAVKVYNQKGRRGMRIQGEAE